MAYYEDAAFSGTAKAHKLVEEAIEVDGPFDGIVGFSQGAGLAISYLLHQRITKPNEPSAFKFGLFFSTSFVLSPDPTYKQDEVMGIFESLSKDDIKSFHELVFNPTSQQKDFENAPFTGKLDQAQRDLFKEIGWAACSVFQTRNQLHITDKVDFIERLKVHDLPPDAFPRFFHPVYTAQRLSIPTVHCWGRNDSDPLRRLAFIGRDLCSDGKAIAVEHSGRHELPIRREDVTAVANAVEKAFYIGQQQAIMV